MDDQTSRKDIGALSFMWRLALGVLTACPMLNVLLMFSVPIHDVFRLDLPLLELALDWLAPLGVGAFAINGLLVVYYLRFILRESQMDPSQRTLWILLVLFAGFFAMPLLYWRYFVGLRPATPSP